MNFSSSAVALESLFQHHLQKAFQMAGSGVIVTVFRVRIGSIVTMRICFMSAC